MEARERIEFLAQVLLEYCSAVVSVRLLMMELQRDPSFLNADSLRYSDATRLRDNLEMTYIIRLFAEFESDLRHFWRFGLRRDIRPSMTDLIEAIGTRRAISRDLIEQTHEIRTYRNFLVHFGEDKLIPSIPIAESKTRLCQFTSYLPRSW